MLKISAVHDRVGRRFPAADSPLRRPALEQSLHYHFTAFWRSARNLSDAAMTDIGLDSTVAFLRRADAYPEAPREVVAIETHMSWVFLTGSHAYKLKKPIRFNGFDLASVGRRRRNCDEEVRLNRRLAGDVYEGVVALTLERGGKLALDGPGEAVDWLVQMRQLPAEDMLDRVIVTGRAAGEEASIRAVARYLAGFYSAARPEPISGPKYCRFLADGVRHDRRELCSARYGLSCPTAEALARAQLAFLEQCAPVFERRVHAGRVVDGHGDLRPEHICLHPVPAIIDCLEFSKELRILDSADELAFLALECERLGDARVGQWFLETYSDVTGDVPPASLLHFYRVYRALRRARIAAAHLDDPSVADPEKFAARARRYLEMVEPVPVPATAIS
jgi:aminoglycoside phosphotransferase family enzyme